MRRRILANEKGNVKFNFLVPGDPYSAYYQQKVCHAGADGRAVHTLNSPLCRNRLQPSEPRKLA